MSREGTTGRLWVVELCEGRRWLTTVGVGLDRGEGRMQLRAYSDANPDDKFRLVRYERARQRRAREVK